ncbi:hypothetical protein [Piscirickettsia litoralis]|uniref:Uncharacterized protein n=1 Tax=Piscirickettsia litoralis TaxID=1891921 RepID=A0ABX3A223_9GAMM|nr:hypothetical protein [Piscirickettsia litoralis]ODN41678.1 hypothetical protein BGC07_00125 [Piscirickettsia litoralis]
MEIEEVTQEELLLRTKQVLQILTSESKKSLFNQCKTLKDLCFLASIQQKRDLLFNTTTMAENLVYFLNIPANALLKRKICPNGEEVRIRDIRNYARYGEKSESQRGWVFSGLNAQDLENQKFFSHSSNANPKDPLLLFKNHSDGSNGSHSKSISLEH